MRRALELRALAALGLAALAGCAGVPRPAVIAHRGASREAPENTLAAIERAIELGADWVEVDVRVSADGVPVLFHDEDLARTTGAEGPLAARTLEELRALDAGAWKDERFAGERIPTLAEAARACDGRVGLMLDFKVDGQGAAILAALRAAQIDGRRVLLGLWKDRQVGDVLPHRTTETLMYIGKAPEDAGGKWVGLVNHLGARALSLDRETITARVVDAAKVRGMPIYAWTADDPDEMRALLELGVDGVVTNDPARLAEVIAERPRWGGAPR